MSLQSLDSSTLSGTVGSIHGSFGARKGIGTLAYRGINSGAGAGFNYWGPPLSMWFHSIPWMIMAGLLWRLING